MRIIEVFQTRPTGPAVGKPLEADGCHCGRQVLEDGHCLTCGKLPVETIRDTFARQARCAARDQRPTRLAA